VNIVFVAPRFHTNQYEITRELISHGHNVEFHVLMIGNTEDHSFVDPKVFTQCTLSKIILRLFGEGGVNMPRAFPRPLMYYNQLRNLSPDLIVVRGVDRYFSLLAAVCGKFVGAKVIFYSQTLLYKRYSLSRKIATKLLLMLFNAVWVTPVYGEKNHKDYPPKYMYYLPFAVPSWINSVKRVKSPKILMIGKYQPRKEHVLLIESLSSLKKSFNFTLTIVGECVTKDQKLQHVAVKSAVSLHKMEKIVNYVNNLPYEEIQKLYTSHDLFVLPSRNEPASISVLEAMANGLPAICSSSCGTRFYIKNGVNGYVFESGNVDDLREKIELLLKDSEMLYEMKLRCLSVFNDNFSSDVYYHKLGGILKDRWGIVLNS